MYASGPYKLGPIEYENGHFYFRREFEWPYGEFNGEFKWAEKQKDPNVE